WPRPLARNSLANMKEKLKLVSEDIIKQYEPVAFQDLITEKLLSWNQIQEISSGLVI
ncbi:unnamed protein product, partial [marine sediment metagenome]